jgi:hypothetical protein
MDEESQRQLGQIVRECANLSTIDLFGSVALSFDDTKRGWLEAADRARVDHFMRRLGEMGLQITSATVDYVKPKIAGPRGVLP